MNPRKLPPHKNKDEPEEEKQKEVGLHDVGLHVSEGLLSFSIDVLRAFRNVIPRLTFGLIGGGGYVSSTAVAPERWLLKDVIESNRTCLVGLEGALNIPAVDAERLLDVVGDTLAPSGEGGTSE